MRKFGILMTILAVLGLGLAGCPSEDDPGNGDEGTPTGTKADADNGENGGNGDTE